MKLLKAVIFTALLALPGACCIEESSAVETAFRKKENLRKEDNSVNSERRELQLLGFGIWPIFHLSIGNPIPFCFAPEAKATVQGKGTVMMKDLVPGDKVLTSNGDYKTMWTMNHYHATKETRFIQITTDLEEEQPLELTPDHMLFVNGKDDPVPASSVKVGDKVLSVQKGLTDVVGIKTVVRNGFYNPQTMGKTIVVDGIVASTYASPTGGTHIEIAGKSLLSHHDAFEMMSTPYRKFCNSVSLDLCNTHKELSGVSQMMMYLFVFWSNQVDAMKYVVYYLGVSFFSLWGMAMSLRSYALGSVFYVFVSPAMGWRTKKTKCVT